MLHPLHASSRAIRLFNHTRPIPSTARMISKAIPHSSSPLNRIEINVDCGEGFGQWAGGPDEELMPLIDAANVACGGHAGDPLTMRRTIALAKKHGVKVGAHPGYPDKAGFGRRPLAMTYDQAYSEMLFQVGALRTMLEEADWPLNHIKPHGQWYISMQNDDEISDAAMKAIAHFKVPVYGMPGTLHEVKAEKYGVEFVPEAFVDVNYDANGVLLGVKGSRKMTPKGVYDTTVKLATQDKIPAADHTPVDVGVSGRPFTLCLHSDFPGCVDNVKAARRAVDEANTKLYQ